MYRLLSLLLVLPPSGAFKHFQPKIPNGDRVPNPFVLNYLWAGVGHNEANGGGTRNPFGRDFARNGYKWDECLCKRDSDEDGWTNGEELGDPDCEWTPGKPPKMNTQLTHPGVCEPVDSDLCQQINRDLNVKGSEPFTCEGVKDNPNIKVADLRFPVTEVPAEETNYFRMYMPLDFLEDGKSYHMLAYEPIVDNAEVLHHIIAYGCRGENDIAMRVEFGDKPPVSMGDMTACLEFLALWTLGINGYCSLKQFGYPIGSHGFTGIFLEQHWNNPAKKAGMTDSSGLRIYYTEDLRDASAAFVLYGPLFLQLPMGRENVIQKSKCPAECMEQSETLYITAVGPHMHYYGREMTVNQLRDGKVFRVLLQDTAYSYDSPVMKWFDSPVEFRPGDELETICSFTTISANKPVFFGLGTYDEMCLALISYYPRKEVMKHFCWARDGRGYCGESMFGNYGNCNFNEFRSQQRNYVGELRKVCDPEGMTCLPGCREAVQSLYDTDPCFDESVRHVTLRRSKSLLKLLIACDNQPVPETTDSTNDSPKLSLCAVNDTASTDGPRTTPKTSGASSFQTSFSTLLFLFVLFCWCYN